MGTHLSQEESLCTYTLASLIFVQLVAAIHQRLESRSFHHAFSRKLCYRRFGGSACPCSCCSWVRRWYLRSRCLRPCQVPASPVVLHIEVSYRPSENYNLCADYYDHYDCHDTGNVDGPSRYCDVSASLTTLESIYMLRRPQSHRRRCHNHQHLDNSDHYYLDANQYSHL